MSDEKEQKPQEYVVEWVRDGKMERVILRGANVEDRAKEWMTAMRADAEAVNVSSHSRDKDQSAQYHPAAVHVGGPTVTLRLESEYKDMIKSREYQSTFFDGANAGERATEFAARAKERAY